MPHATPLISTIVAALVLAFLLGALANRFKLPPLVGYLVAGVLVGPNTPGFVADQSLAQELSEIGVILLMFGVGLHFSLKDLLSVRAVAIPGALVQIAGATGLGLGLATLMGWTLGGGLLFGLALSVASTVVLLKALQERHLIDSEKGRIAVGWLIVEDLAMVLALVLIPALATAGERRRRACGRSARRLGRGRARHQPRRAGDPCDHGAQARRVRRLHADRRAAADPAGAALHGAHRQPRAVPARGAGDRARGGGGGGLSLRGEPRARCVLCRHDPRESELSHRAAEESLPLRDAFAVLFFVAVGMLFDPAVLISNPLPVLATVLIIVVGKSVLAFGIVIAFRMPVGDGAHHRGEPRAGRRVLVHPRRARRGSRHPAGGGARPDPRRGDHLDRPQPAGVLAGGPADAETRDGAGGRADGRLTRRNPSHRPACSRCSPGTASSSDMAAWAGWSPSGWPRQGIRSSSSRMPRIRRATPVRSATRWSRAIAAGGEALALANIAGREHLFVAIPNAFEAGQVIEQARKANPALFIVARAHSDEEAEYLRGLGADHVIIGEREIAIGMADHLKGTEPPSAVA